MEHKVDHKNEPIKAMLFDKEYETEEQRRERIFAKKLEFAYKIAYEEFKDIDDCHGNKMFKNFRDFKLFCTKSNDKFLGPIVTSKLQEILLTHDDNGNKNEPITFFKCKF